MFEAVANTATAGTAPSARIIATPAQLRTVAENLTQPGFIALMLLLEHGYQEDGRVQVLGWGSAWLREHGMGKYASERAAAELRDKGYVRREVGPHGHLGKTLGVVPAFVFGGPPDVFGIPRTDGRSSAGTGAKAKNRGFNTVRVARCGICAGVKPRQRLAGVTTYVVARGEHIKIGSTNNVTDRLRKLNKPNPKVVVPDDFDPSSVLRLVGTTDMDEHVLHERFAKWHVVGEWFRPDQEMMRELSDVVFADLSG
jgi:hypothetical protein